MLKLFLDESGTHQGSLVTAMAGYLIHSEAVIKLESEWQSILSQKGLDELHMREFVPPHGRYAGWNETQKRELLEPLIVLIHKYSLSGVGAALEMDNFMQTVQANAHTRAPELVESPYEWCLRYCSIQAAIFADKNGLDGKIDCVLDAGNANRHYAVEGFIKSRQNHGLADRFRLGTITVCDSKKVPALQCADLLAYEMYKEADRKLSESPRSTRKSFMKLFRENDRLITIDGELVKKQLYRGYNTLQAIISLLPPKEKFQVRCYGLRSITAEKRELIFEAIPAYRKIYDLCLSTGEMGVRLCDLPPEVLPPDDPAILLPLIGFSPEEVQEALERQKNKNPNNTIRDTE
jgi:hypothetical protein